jgi:hypothetical protein
MDIKIFQSGGYAGERIQLKTVSDSQLPADKRHSLQTLLNKAAAYYTSHTKKSNGEVGSDLLQYEIEVPGEKGTYVYKFVKSPNNQPMTELLDFLLSL